MRGIEDLIEERLLQSAAATGLSQDALALWSLTDADYTCPDPGPLPVVKNEQLLNEPFTCIGAETVIMLDDFKIGDVLMPIIREVILFTGVPPIPATRLANCFVGGKPVPYMPTSAEYAASGSFSCTIADVSALVKTLISDPLAAIQDICIKAGMQFVRDIMRPMLLVRLEQIKVPFSIGLQCVNSITDANLNTKINTLKTIIKEMLQGDFSILMINRLGSVCGFGDVAAMLLGPLLRDLFLSWGVEYPIANYPVLHLKVADLPNMAADIKEILLGIIGIGTGNLLGALEQLATYINIPDFYSDFVGPIFEFQFLKLGVMPSIAGTIRLNVNAASMQSILAEVQKLFRGTLEIDMFFRIATALGLPNALEAVVQPIFADLLIKLGMMVPKAIDISLKLTVDSITKLKDIFLELLKGVSPFELLQDIATIFGVNLHPDIMQPILRTQLMRLGLDYPCADKLASADPADLQKGAKRFLEAPPSFELLEMVE
jgi:hypothetical protein